MQKQIKKYIFLIIIFFGFFGLAKISEAVPSVSGVSGTVSHGESVTISGSGFGTKSTAAPIIYDDFENYESNQPLGDTAIWEARTTTIDDDFVISSTNQRNQSSSKNIVADISRPDDDADEAWINDIGFAQTGKAYVNFWVRMNFGTGTASGYQIKMFRLAVGIEDNANAIYPTLALMHWTHNYFPVAGGYTQSYHQLYYGDGTSELFYFSNNSFNLIEDSTPVWVNVSTQLYEGDYNTENAELTYWASKPDGGITAKNQDAGFLYRKTTDHVDAIGLHNYIGTGGTATTLYYDNFYIDNSWARVEIGDNADYDSCTHREIQIPSSWVDGSIAINVNQGSFSDSDTAYLFVVDESGTVSSGQEILFSFSSDTTPPSAPSGLSVS